MKNFITLEGSEGVGKSTQIRLLQEYCAKNNLPAVFTREPGGCIIAEDIRKIILDPNNKEMSDVCEAFLYASARIQHLKESSAISKVSRNRFRASATVALSNFSSKTGFSRYSS